MMEDRQSPKEYFRINYFLIVVSRSSRSLNHYKKNLIASLHIKRILGFHFGATLKVNCDNLDNILKHRDEVKLMVSNFFKS